MSEVAPELPADVEVLQALVLATRTQLDSAIAERDAALSQNDRLRHMLRVLQRAQFGRRSEKLDPDQLLLAIEDTEQAIAANEAAADKSDPAAEKVRTQKRRSNRGALPRHLPRVDVTIEPEDTNCPCCRSPMHQIGKETSERLDVIPAQFRVIVTHRPKYACRACEAAVVQAPAPERLIKGGLPTEAMVAHVLVSKYAWHLPLYRQSQILCSQGLDIKRSVLAFWVGYAASSNRSTAVCANTFSARARSRWMRRRRQCSIPGAARPRRGTCGPLPATIGPGKAVIRPRSLLPMRQAAARCMR
jgi:transposase